MTTKLKFSAPEVSQALDRLAGAIVEACGTTQNLMFVGVADGGVGVAHRLAEKVEESLGRKIPLGIVDVSFHRDDIGSNPIPKAVVPTNLPPEVEGSSCILVDDVIFRVAPFGLLSTSYSTKDAPRALNLQYWWTVATDAFHFLQTMWESSLRLPLIKMSKFRLAPPILLTIM